MTHVAQNTRRDQARVLEFVTIANQQIQTFGIDPRCIVNIDEMKINFYFYGSLTLEKCGAGTIGIMKTSGTSGRCTLPLGVTLSGEMLPPFIVFKGTSDGQISGQLAINSTKRISGFSEILLPDQGLSRPNCLLELD